MVLKSPAAMHINWPGGGGGGAAVSEASVGGQQRSATELRRREQERQVESLKKILQDALAYGNAKDARAKDPSLPKQNIDLKLEALIPVARGQMPVVINANLERDLKNAIAFVVEMKLKAIISGGRWRHTEWRISSRREISRSSSAPGASNAGKGGRSVRRSVHQRWVVIEGGRKDRIPNERFCLFSRNLPYHAGMAAAFGLPKEEALKAVTIYPAEIFGIADRVGWIEPGKIANLIVTDGVPAEDKDTDQARFHQRSRHTADEQTHRALRKIQSSPVDKRMSDECAEG